jgi:ABC-type multidrug transport system ATPase subunit
VGYLAQPTPRPPPHRRHGRQRRGQDDASAGRRRRARPDERAAEPAEAVGILPLGTLSPGQRSRLLIAVLVSSGSELLLLDEPTNHLDFDSLAVIEEALRQFRGTIVAVSHDRAFVENIGCDRHIEIRGGRLREHPAPATG